MKSLLIGFSIIGSIIALIFTVVYLADKFHHMDYIFYFMVSLLIIPLGVLCYLLGEIIRKA